MNTHNFPRLVANLAKLEHVRAEKSLWRYTLDSDGSVSHKSGFSLISAFFGRIWHWIKGTTKKNDLEVCKRIFNQVIEKAEQPMPALRPAALSEKQIKKIVKKDFEILSHVQRKDIEAAKRIFGLCDYLKPDFHPQPLYTAWAQTKLPTLEGVDRSVWEGIVWEKELPPEDAESPEYQEFQDRKFCLQQTKEIFAPFAFLPESLEQKLYDALKNSDVLEEYTAAISHEEGTSPFQALQLIKSAIQNAAPQDGTDLSPQQIEEQIDLKKRVEKDIQSLEKASYKENCKQFNSEGKQLWSKTQRILGKHFYFDTEQKVLLSELLKNGEFRDSYKTFLSYYKALKSSSLLAKNLERNFIPKDSPVTLVPFLFLMKSMVRDACANQDSPADEKNQFLAKLERDFQPLLQSFWNTVETTFSQEERGLWEETANLLGADFSLDYEKKLTLYELLKDNTVRQSFAELLPTSLEVQAEVIKRLQNGDALQITDPYVSEYTVSICQLDQSTATHPFASILPNPVNNIFLAKCGISNTQIYTDTLCMAEANFAGNEGRELRHLELKNAIRGGIDYYSPAEQALFQARYTPLKSLGIWKKGEWTKDFGLPEGGPQALKEIRSRQFQFSFAIPDVECITVSQTLYSSLEEREGLSDEQLMNVLQAVMDTHDQEAAFNELMNDPAFATIDQSKLHDLIFTFLNELTNKINAAYIQIGNPSITFPELTSREVDINNVFPAIRELLGEFEAPLLTEDVKNLVSKCFLDTQEHEEQFKQFIRLCKEARAEHLGILASGQPIPLYSPYNLAGFEVLANFEPLLHDLGDKKDYLRPFLWNLAERAVILNDQILTDGFYTGLPPSIKSTSPGLERIEDLIRLNDSQNSEDSYPISRDGSGIMQKSLWKDIDGTPHQPFISGYRVIGLKSSQGTTREEKVFLDIEELGPLNYAQCKKIFEFLLTFNGIAVRQRGEDLLQLQATKDLLEEHVHFLDENKRRILVNIGENFWDRMNIAFQSSLLNLGHTS